MSSVLELVQPGALVFDIGANRGSKAAQYFAAGAGRVVCVEPQAELAAHLRSRFAAAGARVATEECAVSATVGTAEMLMCDQADTISTLEPKFQEGRFKGSHTWSKRRKVLCTTLDALVGKYGVPGFTKVDVEGHEVQVLAGLTRPLPALSFEYHSEFEADAAACCARLGALGQYEYNMGAFDHDAFVLDRWVCAKAVLAWVPTLGGGDIYARRVG